MRIALNIAMLAFHVARNTTARERHDYLYRRLSLPYGTAVLPEAMLA
eukprot:COSAG02_NODE_2324_length_9133_cov_38.463361_6_plen_47_part_00